MAKQKSRFYVVWVGRTPGVYEDWRSCEAQIKGVDAKYKAFATRVEADTAYKEGFEKYISFHSLGGKRGMDKSKSSSAMIASARIKPVYPSLAVDAACSGNPGKMEFRVVVADTGTEVLRRGPYEGGTNNIGEFLAIVLGLAYLKKNNLDWVLYSDSRTALSWLRQKHAKTNLVCSAANKPIFDMLQKAEDWLAMNTYMTSVRKWDTEHWGEIPADFGRKK